jgi:hypothetical protein
MAERALEATCRDCGQPLSFHAGERAPARCEGCFENFLQIRDEDFLTSYQELGVRSRRIIAETSFRALVMESPPHRKVLAMHIMEQYVHAASDLIGLYSALKQRGHQSIMRTFMEFQLDRTTAVGFFREIANTPAPELMRELGLPLPEQVADTCSSLSKKDAKDLARALDQMLYDLNYTSRMGETAALALAQMAGESRGGAALMHQSSWLDSVGLRADQVAAMAIDEKRRTVNVTAIAVDEKKLEHVVSAINAMTRASENLIYGVLSMYQEDERKRAKSAASVPAASADS